MKKLWRAPVFLWSWIFVQVFVGRAAADGSAPLPSELRVVSYNVLADRDEAEARVPELLRILRETNADIIALQEVAPWFVEKLLNEDWARDYHRQTRDGKTVIAHEYLILSRYPVSDHAVVPLPGRQRRVLFAVTVDLPAGKTRVAACHLDSLLEDGPIRAKQLDVYFEHLGESSEAFFLGDFNFGDGEQPDTAHLIHSFRDAWLVVSPHLPGFTWDIETSPMARAGSFTGEASRRLDRILYRSNHWTPVSVSLLGTRPISKKRADLFPSDHFGLLAVFKKADAVR